MTFLFPISDEIILRARSSKNVVDPYQPYAFLTEQECQPNGLIEDVAVLFLTNRECPLRCLMCDLWKNTTDESVPIGAIPAQIDFGLSRLRPTKHIKLYNSGNFFDPLAIPPQDYVAIADRMKAFETVIVENHPLMCGPRIAKFLSVMNDSEATARLEVAMGLETIHPTVLPMLNKQMTTATFRHACDYLHSLDVLLRAFVLLRPPTLTEPEGIDWAVRSIEFAFACGVQTVSIIPTRGGNGIMERLQIEGMFSPPRLASIEIVLEAGLTMNRGRVFVDLWDAQRTFALEENSPARIDRLQQIMLIQRSLPRLEWDTSQ